MTTLYSSDFTQADGAPSGWSAAGANPLPQVVGNRLQSTSSVLTEMINILSFPTTTDIQVDFDCKASLVTGDGGVGVGLLDSTGTGGWYVLLSNSVHVYTYSGGVRQAARTNDDRTANGVDTQHCTWTYQASNNQVTVYLDGVQWSQTSLAGTKVGTYLYVYMESAAYPSYVEFLDNLVVKDVITGPPPTVALEQEGFRWRNDDGSETSATWKAAQDTDLTAPLSANVRLRTIVNATGDPASNNPTLYFKKSTDSVYVPVPVGSATTLPTYVDKGTFQSGTGALSVPAPAGIQANDVLLLAVESANEAITTPSGYTQVTNSPQSTGTAATAGGVRLGLFYKVTSGTESNVSVADTGNHTTAIITAFRGCDPTTPVHITAGKVDSTATTAMSWPAVTTTLANCMIVNVAALDADVASTAAVGAPSNASLTNVTERHDQTVIAGAGGGLTVTTGEKATAGSSGTTTATGSTSTTHAYLTVALAPAPVSVYVSPSSNITAGGVVTTAQLTAPSGKTTSNFTTGRMWDDENGADAIDIASGNYTEVEWCLQAQAPAATADVYTFEVYAGSTALDTYTVTPQWTIGSGTSPQTTTAQIATLTLSGVQGTSTGGAVSKVAQVATLTLTAVQGTSVRGTVTTVAQVATLTLSALAGTSTVGAVTRTAQPATLTLSGVQGTSSVGPVSTTAQVATITLTGVAGSSSIAGGGAQSTTAQPATLALTGLAGTSTVGPVTTTAQGATIALSGVQGVSTGGATSRAAQVATLTLTAVPGVSTVGGVTTVAQVATVTLTGVQGASSIGAVTTVAQPATLTLTGVQGTSSGGPVTVVAQVATITLTAVQGANGIGSFTQTTTAQAATLTLTALPGVSTGGPVTRAAQVAVLALSAVAGTSTTGPVTTTAQPATVTLSGVQGTNTVGQRTVAQPATITLTALAGTSTGGPTTLAAQPATITLIGVAGVSRPGPIGNTAQAATITLTALQGTNTTGQRTVAQVATVTITALQGVSTGGPTTLTAQVATVTLTAVPGVSSGGPTRTIAQPATLAITAVPGLSFTGIISPVITGVLTLRWLDAIRTLGWADDERTAGWASPERTLEWDT